ncbi:peroxisomal N(1)-acetyl-spermine/spermidine oxidase-like [Hypanus sabinus]|uniref:peroxisomal N(1)-acetyl-spermine/spermidine oxidase-like n=1 Tax=Hypanus sabinus TaxID=79690 RepID=UPI0028C43AF9|nr:peroxisomal N(1)-acetyl-spermine/spermidine oxidase-like [Hypanus sabinus]
MPKKGPKVVVIGAGIVGVGAAGKLLTQGLTDVQIIEASSQPGGRIRGSLFGKSIIDEGSQYIHGASTKNPVYQLAKEHDLLQETHDRSGPELLVLTNVLFPNLLQKLLEAIPREILLLKKPINQIQWNGSFESGDVSMYPVRVVCEDGDHILADHIIVSISLGCLKANGQSFFQPRLPEQKLSAIQGLGFGTMNKIYLESETLLWVENTDVIGLVWEDETPFSVQKPNLTEWWKHVPVFYVVRPTESAASLPSFPFNITSNAANLLSSFSSKRFEIACKMLQVLFAGEAAHQSYHSTTHRALLSVWREATRLIDHYFTK